VPALIHASVRRGKIVSPIGEPVHDLESKFRVPPARVERHSRRRFE
jgi:hypothetical protein